MATLNKQYLATRSSNIHTDESFAKAFFEQALRAGEAQIGDGAAESIKLQNVEIELRPYQVAEQNIGCVEVCIIFLGQKICKQVCV